MVGLVCLGCVALVGFGSVGLVRFGLGLGRFGLVLVRVMAVVVVTVMSSLPFPLCWDFPFTDLLPPFLTLLFGGCKIVFGNDTCICCILLAVR